MKKQELNIKFEVLKTNKVQNPNSPKSKKKICKDIKKWVKINFPNFIHVITLENCINQPNMKKKSMIKTKMLN